MLCVVNISSFKAREMIKTRRKQWVRGGGGRKWTYAHVSKSHIFLSFVLFDDTQKKVSVYWTREEKRTKSKKKLKEKKEIFIHRLFAAVELNCKQFQNVYIPHEFLMLPNPTICFLCIFSSYRLGVFRKKAACKNYNVSVYACVQTFGYIAGNNRALSAKEAIIIKSKAQLKCHRNKIPYRIAFRSWFLSILGLLFRFLQQHTNMPHCHCHYHNAQIKLNHTVFFSFVFSFHTHKIRNLDLCNAILSNIEKHTYQDTRLKTYTYRPQHTHIYKLN